MNTVQAKQLAIRTLTPVIAGLILQWPITAWLGLTTQDATGTAIVIICAAWSIGGHLAERYISPQWGWLLGIPWHVGGTQSITQTQFHHPDLVIDPGTCRHHWTRIRNVRLPIPHVVHISVPGRILGDTVITCCARCCNRCGICLGYTKRGDGTHTHR